MAKQVRNRVEDIQTRQRLINLSFKTSNNWGRLKHTDSMKITSP